MDNKEEIILPDDSRSAKRVTTQLWESRHGSLFAEEAIKQREEFGDKLLTLVDIEELEILPTKPDLMKAMDEFIEINKGDNILV